MTDSPRSLWRRFLALPNDSLTKTLGVAFLVSLVCAVAVSMTAITLKPYQQAHIDAAREARLASMVATLPGLADILRETGADTLTSVIVDLTTGALAPDIDAAAFDFLAAQTDPERSSALSPDADLARIGRRPDHAPVYILRDGDHLALVVLPVYGLGYQSTIRAYLALKGDLNTIAGLSIYEQGETPGLGSRISGADWQAQFEGRVVNDAAGAVAITLVRAGATEPHEIDGLTGATRSATGVVAMVQFWMGPQGYGPFLSRLINEES